MKSDVQSGISFQWFSALHRRALVGLFLLLTWLGSAEAFGQVKIVEYDRTKLTWTNSMAPATYKVEYSTDLTRPWVVMTTVASTSEKTMTVETPGTSEQMVFYRVVWSDAPVANPIGTWVYEGHEGNSLTVTGLVTIVSLEPFDSHLSFKAVVQPRPNHLTGEYSSEIGIFAGNRIGISVPAYQFSLEGLVVEDEINGTWSITAGGIGFPIPTPPRVYSGTFRATRAP